MSNLKKNLEAARIKLSKHPGGENLKIIESSEQAKEMQLKSAKARVENNKIREEAARILGEFKKRGKELESLNLTGLEVMKLIMGDAIVKGDTRTAAALAAQVAEYETPKLSRQEVHSTVQDVTELSDKELQELLELETRDKTAKGVH
jgi:hypothetical protein